MKIRCNNCGRRGCKSHKGLTIDEMQHCRGQIKPKTQFRIIDKIDDSSILKLHTMYQRLKGGNMPA